MSDRETCVAKLAEILATISTANGYGVDLGTPVARNLTTIEELNDNEFDMIIVEDNGDGESESIDLRLGDEARISFTIPIIGYVRKKDSDASVTTAINRLDQAVKKIIGQPGNRRIAGIWVALNALPLLGRSGSENGEYGWFIRPIKIDYDSNATTGM